MKNRRLLKRILAEALVLDILNEQKGGKNKGKRATPARADEAPSAPEPAEGGRIRALMNSILGGARTYAPISLAGAGTGAALGQLADVIRHRRALRRYLAREQEKRDLLRRLRLIRALRADREARELADEVARTGESNIGAILGALGGAVAAPLGQASISGARRLGSYLRNRFGGEQQQ